MSNVGYGTLQIIPSARGFGAALNRQTTAPLAQGGREGGRRFGGAFSAAVTPLAGVAAGALAAVGVAGLVKDSVSLEASFSQTMNTMAAVADVPAADIKKLSALALKMGADTVFSANDAAGAMLELAKGGLSAATIQGGALQGTLTLAAAGGTDLGTAATIASNALNTFGLKGKDMASVAAALAGGANASSASVASLGDALGQVGPGARLAGLNLQTTVGILSAFDAAGIKGSDAGTSLKTMLTRLVPQSKAASNAMHDLGLKFTDAHGQFLPMTAVAEELKKKLGGLSEEQRTTALATIFGSDAARAASVMMNLGAAGVQKYTKATSDQTAAQRVAAASMAGTAGALESMSGSFETAKLAVGQFLAPATTAGAKFMTDQLNKVGPAIQKIPAVAAAAKAKFDALAAAINRNATPIKVVAGVITAVFLPALLRTGTLATISGAQQAAAWALAQVAAVRSAAVQTAALVTQGFKWLALGPTALGVAGLVVQAWVMSAASAVRSAAVTVASLVAQGAAWVASGARAVTGAAVIASAWLVSKASAAASIAIAIAGLVAQGIAWAAGAAAAMASALVIAAAWLISLGPIGLVIAAVIAIAVLIALNMDRIKGWISAAWEWIKSATASVWNWMKDIFNTVLSAISAVVSFYFNLYKAVIMAVFDAVKSVVDTAWNFIKSLFNTVLGAISAEVSFYFNLYKTVITTVFSAVSSFISAAWNAIKAVFLTVIGWLVAYVSAQFNAIRAAITTVWNAIKTGAEIVWNAIKSAVSNAVDHVKAVLAGLSGIAGTVVGYFQKIKDGIVQKFADALDFVRGIPGRIMGALGNVGSMLYNVGGNIVDGLVNGISNAAGRVMSAIRRLISGVPEAAKNLLGIHSPSRVFAEIGGYTADGFILGLDRRAAAAQSAIGRVVAVPDAPPIRPGGLAGAFAASSFGGGIAASGPLIGTAVLREEVDVDVMARRLEFALSGGTLGGGSAR